ncbi:hypothetical protein Hypma_011604 [Hypsizygus marmoreus]|uniref:Plasma membrane proteolipid 3 n=1 Tax=Hypsizygus marmoreus TaxID=39966 RepID=A0A369JJJ2_HYPMA|nr:hypothetical protein Hypma_011604 [Hypsizygus marmoreus]
MASYVPTKIDLTPRRHHGYAVLLFILGTLFPPLAVAARFGIGKDFWLNLLLTICGYIPGHGHNFYIQNIRNNKNNARTPKWAQRYGLVDTSEIQRKQRKSQWATRYNERLPNSTLEGQPYEEGQEQGSSVDLSIADGSRPQRQPNGDLWRPEDESYYNAEAPSTSSGRWRYPANFDDAALPKRKKSKKEKKDRWARTEDAYSLSEEQSQRRKSKKKKKKKKDNGDSIAGGSIDSRDSTTEFPEAAEGGLYGDGPSQGPSQSQADSAAKGKTPDDVFSHQF